LTANKKKEQWLTLKDLDSPPLPAKSSNKKPCLRSSAAKKMSAEKLKMLPSRAPTQEPTTRKLKL